MINSVSHSEEQSLALNAYVGWLTLHVIPLVLKHLYSFTDLHIDIHTYTKF